MQVTINRKKHVFSPDSSRVIARFLYLEEERTAEIIRKVLALPEKEVNIAMSQLLRGYSRRHRNISRIFEKHFNRLIPILNKIGVKEVELSISQKALIGSFFTLEYSIESAAFFNPSIVEHPDQTEIRSDEKRIILSFRATGEGHISSVVFRSGILDRNNNLTMEPVGKMLAEADRIIRNVYDKKSFRDKLEGMHEPEKAITPIIIDNMVELHNTLNTNTANAHEKPDEVKVSRKVFSPDFIFR